MCTFDSPIARCEAMHTMVLTDQTQRDCAREHDCPREFDCPLNGCFTGSEVRAAAPPPPIRRYPEMRLAA